ncbi:Hsp20/alpha crystallin family protein [Candidatus Peregrinibacteria bacterium]|nr:MAG: Hsp20/alpha crystallin family protein [Candidatus Peregrinibacteria bacterium]
MRPELSIQLNEPIIKPSRFEKEPSFQSPSDGQLPLDVYENEHDILIITPIAGVDLDQTDIIVTNDVLTIRGERRPDLSPFRFNPDTDAYLRECFWGEFSRSILLPSTILVEHIEATEKNHVLYIRLPKQKNLKMHIVKITPVSR